MLPAADGERVAALESADGAIKLEGPNENGENDAADLVDRRVAGDFRGIATGLSLFARAHSGLAPAVAGCGLRVVAALS